MTIPNGRTLYIGKHRFKENETVPVHLEEKARENLEHTPPPEPPPELPEEP